ncbi:DUF3021 domain-containing protein [Lentibacillus salinarum]|uniref:DUF3021 domain-containing protein n=1 Tax=Lentibacillus salinarum TaxID=446820 RepID=A0ABW3ZZM6_9BACI
MIVEAIRRSMMGIALGGIVTFIALTIVYVTGVDASVPQIWLYMLSSFIIGIYFGLASFIFEDNGWSNLKKTVIHFALSIVVYFIVGLSVGWVLFTLPGILWTSLLFVFVYALFWIGYYLYYKKVEASMNANLPKKD